MLSTLRVRNLAVVASLELALEPGLTVITGETGSGKSILVHALQLVLGARANPDLVRAGADRAEVEALFEVGDDPAVRSRLAALDLPEDDEIVIRRTVTPAGRSRATVNGRLATAAQLQALAAGLIDLSSQHEHHTLADPGNHLATLDAWAARPELGARMREAWRAAVEAERAATALEARLSDRADRQDLLRFQVGEIDRLDPRPGELEEVEALVDRLRHAGALRETTSRAEHALYGRDRAICAELGRLQLELRGAAAHDPALGPLVEQLGSARAELEDAAAELGRYARRVDADPEALSAAEERLAALRRLARRFGSIDEALAHRLRAAEELAQLDDGEAWLARARGEAERALQAAAEAAAALSEARREAAATLGRAIGSELADLGMGHAEVQVEVAPLTGEGGLGARGVRLTEQGQDRAEILIAPNPGEPPKPLRRIASGGELSRALLATKRVLAGLGPVGTYLFDEVDTGVGGAVADAIGRKLAEVARHHQVVCITHLPQIAAFGRSHVVVAKQVEQGRTASRAERLSPAARVEELARMLGGRDVTEEARSAARALLAHAGA